MNLTVNLWSGKKGEIKRFLDMFYDRDSNMDEGTGEWEYVYKKPLEAIDIINAVMDNSDKYQINLCIQIDEGQMFHITSDNHNEVIRDMFGLFYNECNEHLN